MICCLCEYTKLYVCVYLCRVKKSLNKEILRLSLPSILANITVPLVGMVDTAVAGHLPGADGAGAATFIGAISVGAMLFNLLYWNFGFLRTGTGGLTAQAFGRGDMGDCARIGVRAVLLAFIIAAGVLILQWPFERLGMWIVDSSEGVESFAAQYFFIRIWAAPATLGLMAFSGWFVGMQDSMSSMWKDLIVNAVNIVASVLLALGCGNWDGLGFAGVAWGTVIAQYSGLLFCLAVSAIKYRRVFCTFRKEDLAGLFSGDGMHGFFRMNVNLFGRSVCFTLIYVGYTLIAAKYTDVMLACSSVMMQLLMIFSYFTDGFAYAGEALTGRFIGAGDEDLLRRTVKYIFVWSMSIAVLFVGLYMVGGVPVLKLLTSDEAVVEACRQFLPWLILMPPLGCAAFTWDGIFLGATASRAICMAMAWAAAGFFAVWSVAKYMLVAPAAGTPGYDALAIHCLMAAYFVHLLARTIYLTYRYRRDIRI